MEGRTTHHREANETRRAVLFIRVNRRAVGDEDAADAQVERQRQHGMDVARRLGAVVVREYVDHGGGLDLEHRPPVEAMLDDFAAKRDADYVIADDWARLTRRADDMAVIHRVVEEAGARLVVDGNRADPGIMLLFEGGDLAARWPRRTET
jgi:DNA invertase Pin-like site-specific DNA recombinase